MWNTRFAHVTRLLQRPEIAYFSSSISLGRLHQPVLPSLVRNPCRRERRGSRLTSSSRLFAVRLFERTGYLGGLIKLPVKRSTTFREFPIQVLYQPLLISHRVTREVMPEFRVSTRTPTKTSLNFDDLIKFLVILETCQVFSF